MKMDREKRVIFDSTVKVHIMHVWAYAYQDARKSNWMKFAADRYRFDLRKQRLEAEFVKIKFFSKQRIATNADC